MKFPRLNHCRIAGILLLGAPLAVCQEKAEQVSPERARANFGRPIALAADDVRAFPEAPAGYDKPAANGMAGRTEVFDYDSTVTGVKRKVVVYLPPGELVPDPAAALQLKLLNLSCGNKDGPIDISQAVHRYLKEKDVPHLWTVEDHGHDGGTWGSNLYHFTRRMFR